MLILRRALLGIALLAASAHAQIDLALARRYFEQVRQTSDRDAGRTWGVSLYGPIFFVDPSSRVVVANRPDPQNVLQAKDGIWTGTFPDRLNPANTAIDWLGVRWTMVLWPVNDYRQPREDPQPGREAALAAAARYEGQEVISIETRRAEEREKRIAAARQKFIEGPVLILPLSKDVDYSFDPNNVIGIDSLNTVYPTMRLVDAWGILEVTDGAWLIRGGNGLLVRAQVPAPQSGAAAPLQGEGWTLRLTQGWKIVAAERRGDFKVENAAANP
jgi:hypothetical protein